MKQILTVLLIIMGASTGFCQTSHEIEEVVKSFVTNTASEGHWKKIYAKLLESKENISPQQCMLFYYSNGVKAIKQRPFQSLNFDPDRYKMFKSAYRNEWRRVKKLGLRMIEINPFDLGTLVYLSMSLDKLENNTENEYFSRMRCIVDSIFKTGDGKTPETAIKISEIGDDELLIGFTGFNGKKLGDQEIKGNLYSVWENRIGEKFYFDYVFIFL